MAGYTFITNTGAEYVLTQSGDVWISKQGAHVTWDAASAILHFNDGSSWEFGCVSSAGEPDAGATYPTTLQDSHGNQIIVQYLPGRGASAGNTSARISEIREARAANTTSGRRTYLFVYDSGATPHLLSISSQIGTGERHLFSYSIQQVNTAFGNAIPDLVSVLQSVTPAATRTLSLSYNGYGEMTGATLPDGALLAWDYHTFSFGGGTLVREVSSRTLAASSSAKPATMEFLRDPRDSNALSHSTMTVQGSSGSGQRVWTFGLGSQDVNFAGLVTSMEWLDANSTSLRRQNVEWSTDSNGVPYVSALSLTLDPGTINQQVARREVTRDIYGNIITTRLFDFGNVSTPVITYTNSYLDDPAYTTKYIRNRLASSNVSDGSTTLQLLNNQYDTTPLIDRIGQLEHDLVNYGPENTIRGNITESWSGGIYRRRQFDVTGLIGAEEDSSGHQTSFLPAQGSNNALIGTVLPKGTDTLAIETTFDQAFRAVAFTRDPGCGKQRCTDSFRRSGIHVRSRWQDNEGNGPQWQRHFHHLFV